MIDRLFNLFEANTIKSKMKQSEAVQSQLAPGKSFYGFQIVQIIGSGTFGKVYLVKQQSSSKKMAMKHVLQNKRYKNREQQILKTIEHSNIVKLHYSFYSQQKQGTFLNLIMEYLPQTLSKCIKYNYINKELLEEKYVVSYTKGLLQALAYLHGRNICHRDIKPSNILIEETEAKICDFGSAKVLNENQKNVSYICSRYYRAPQLLFGAAFYSYQVDIWSLGCVIFEMITNRALFQGSNSTSMIFKIIKTIGSPTKEDVIKMRLDPEEMDISDSEGVGIRARLIRYSPSCDERLIELLEKMIVFDPEKRIKAQQALKLPIFAE